MCESPGTLMSFKFNESMKYVDLMYWSAAFILCILYHFVLMFLEEFDQLRIGCGQELWTPPSVRFSGFLVCVEG